MVDLHDDELHVLVQHTDTHTCLSVRGELDLSNADRLAQRLAAVAATGCGDVHVDLSLVGFCDSTGLKALIGAHRQLAAAGRHLVVVAPSEQVRHLLDITGLLDTLVPGG
jgi:anti-sigma B factor antagonist